MYLLVAISLGLCTVASFFCNNLAQINVLSDLNSFWIILALATIKAGLVAHIFMHLKWDGKFVYFILFPVCILAILLVVVLLPDTLFAQNLELMESGQF
ncbi:MAG: cytochrome C oxidase subunit IV family protein, partial [Gemmataceae bacterium]